jgi:hypothetical protein
MNFAINVNNGALSGNSQTNPQGDNEIINILNPSFKILIAAFTSLSNSE